MTTLCTRIAGAACLSAVLAGCAATYEVSVRNRTDQPVTATLSKGGPRGMGDTLAWQRIGPGDRDTLGPVRTGPLKRVFLRVDFMGNVEAPAITRMRRGYTGINVVRADEGSQGTITLEKVRP